MTTANPTPAATPNDCGDLEQRIEQCCRENRLNFGRTDYGIKAKRARDTAVSEVRRRDAAIEDLPEKLRQINREYDAAEKAAELAEKENRYRDNRNKMPRAFDPDAHDNSRLPNPSAFALVQKHFSDALKETGNDFVLDPLPAPWSRNVVCFGTSRKAKTRAIWAGLHQMMKADALEPDMWLHYNCAELADEIIEKARSDAAGLRKLVRQLSGENDDGWCVYLFLDDLSKAPLTERYGRELYKIVNARFEKGFPTFVTSQDGPEDMIEAMARGDEDAKKKLRAILGRLTQDGDALVVDFDHDYSGGQDGGVDV